MIFFEKKIDELLQSCMFHNKGIPTHVAILFSKKTVVQIQTNIKYGKHAEENILKTIKEWQHRKRLRLFVTKTNGDHRMSRPCWYCSKQLKKVPGLRVFYTDKYGSWMEDVNLDSEHLSMRDFHNILHPQCRIHHNPPQIFLKTNNITIENCRLYFKQMKVTNCESG